MCSDCTVCMAFRERSYLWKLLIANSQIYLLEVMLIHSMTVFLVHHFPTGLHIFCKCSYTGLKTSPACMWGKLRNDYIMKLYNLYHWSERVNDRARDKQHPRLRRLYQQHCRGYIRPAPGKSPASPAVIRALPSRLSRVWYAALDVADAGQLCGQDTLHPVWNTATRTTSRLPLNSIYIHLTSELAIYLAMLRYDLWPPWVLEVI